MKTRILQTLIVLALLSGSQSAISLGSGFTYQGRLTDLGGPANGTYDLTFSVFDVSTGGIAVAGPVTNSAVAVANGLFTITLDFGNTVFNGNDLWLEIGVRTNGGGAFTALSPRRQQLTTVPYATYSLAAGVANSIASTAVVQGQSLNIGTNNTLNGIYSTITGGSGNSISGTVSTVSGGNGNDVNGSGDYIGGGIENLVSGEAATIGGGYHNQVNGTSGTVAGGEFNTAGGDHSTVAGGEWNLASGTHAFVGGGLNNIAGSDEDVVVGGIGNIAAGDPSFIGAGMGNKVGTAINGKQALGLSINSWIVAGVSNSVQADNSGIGGGGYNTIQTNASYSFIGGGFRNTVKTNATYSTISGGFTNVIGAFGNSYAAPSWATIPGGYFNFVGGAYAFAAGRQAKANYNGDFVWADSTAADFASTANNQFLIRASGGVGIGTTFPGASLDVNSGSFGNAIHGNTSSGIGVYGSSTSSSSTSYGVYGSGPYGVYGLDSLGNGIGVYGTSTSGQGVYGNSPSGAGVHGQTTGGKGVRGVSTSGDAIYGTSSSGNGVYGTSSSGYGVYAVGANSATALLAINSPGTGYGAYLGTPSYAADCYGPVRINGNLGIQTSSAPTHMVQVGPYSSPAYCDGGQWVNGSDRNMKKNFVSIKPREVLDKVMAMPIMKWEFKMDAGGVTHLGPMAQDFHAAFDLNGSDDTHISTVDEGGVALAAIQGLNQKLDEKNSEIQDLKQTVDELKKMMQSLSEKK